MRSVSAGLATAFSSNPKTLCWLFRGVLKDGTVIRVTDISTSLTIDVGHGSETYVKDVSFKGATLVFRGDGDVPDGRVTAPIALTGAYDSQDVFTGVLDEMSITLYVVNYSNTANGGMQLGPYTVAKINYDDRGKIASFEVRGRLQKAKHIQVEELSVGCRSDLGDMRPGYCNLPLYPDDVERATAYVVGDYVRFATAGNYGNRMFRCTTAGTTDASPVAYNYTVAATTTDGTAVFTAEEAWVRSAVVATRTADDDFTLTVTESRSVDNWFANGGIIKFTSGANAGQTTTVRAYTHSTKRVRLWLPPPHAVTVADTLEIMPGCDKSFPMCRDRFGNSINNRGEDLLPGTDFVNGAG